MTEARLTFKREEREGVVPVGTYLSDAARRMGIIFEAKCEPAQDLHFCEVTIEEGSDHLSETTSAEKKHLSADSAAPNARLACQTKIIEPGEIVIMTKETKKTKEETEAATKEKYVKEFAELPLEKKIAELVHLEAVTLSETFSFVLNAPYIVFDKVMDVMADLGLRKEAEGKKATRPKEHVETNGDGKSKTGESESANAGEGPKNGASPDGE